MNFNLLHFRLLFSLASLRFVIVGLGLVSFVALPAAAEYIHPGNVKVSTKRYSPQANSLLPGTYHYSVKWEGIPVAKASVEIREDQKKDELVSVAAKTKTSGLVRAFYSMNYTSESIFRKSDFQPVSFSSYQKENSKRKFRNIQFDKDGSVVSERWKKGKEKTKIAFDSENVVFDPISAAFLAKSLDLEEGKKISFDVYNGKHRFLISFAVKGKELVKIKGKKRLAYKVIPSVSKLTDSEGEKKLRSAALWISADEDRELLKLESEVAIGSVIAVFERFDELKDISNEVVETAQDKRPKKRKSSVRLAQR